MNETVRVNGIDVAYRLEGPEGAPALTFSNSLASNLGMWDDQAAAFAGEYRVLRYDTRGHGGTQAPAGPYDMAMLAADLLALWDSLGIGTGAFCGCSMGGMIGQHLGIHHGDRLRALVLCDTIAEWPEGAGSMWEERIASAREHGMAAMTDATLARWFTRTYRDSGGPALERIGAMIRNTPVEGFVGCCHAIRNIDYLKRVSEIRTPVLLIAGKDDPSTPVSGHEAIRDRVAGSETRGHRERGASGERGAAGGVQPGARRFSRACLTGRSHNGGRRGGARRVEREIQTRRTPGSGHARRTARPAHDGDRIPRREPGDRAERRTGAASDGARRQPQRRRRLELEVRQPCARVRGDRTP